jgi:hypothetical protein
MIKDRGFELISPLHQAREVMAILNGWIVSRSANGQLGGDGADWV